MPNINLSTSVAANATNENVITGSAFERLPYAAVVEISNAAAAAGILVTFQSGSDVVMENGVSRVGTVMGQYPEDYDIQDVVMPGELLKLRLQNTTGSAIVNLTGIRITPI